MTDRKREPAAVKEIGFVLFSVVRITSGSDREREKREWQIERDRERRERGSQQQ